MQAAQIRRMHRFGNRTAAAEPKRPKDAWSEVLAEAAWMATAFRRYPALSRHVAILPKITAKNKERDKSIV